MTVKFNTFTSDMLTSTGIDDFVYSSIRKTCKYLLPLDFVSFMFYSNGAEGKIGDNYLVIWDINKIMSNNKDYDVETFVPGLLLFGSDGGGEAFGFDYRKEPPVIVKIPFIGMNWKLAIKVSNNFLEFLMLMKGVPNE